VTGIFHIVLARKPLEGTIAENCLQWGCGALWIDGCRVMLDDHEDREKLKARSGGIGERPSGSLYDGGIKDRAGFWDIKVGGRFPANLILGGEEVVEGFPSPHGAGNKRKTPCTISKEQVFSGGWKTQTKNPDYYADSGSASRFFFNFSEQESDE